MIDPNDSDARRTLYIIVYRSLNDSLANLADAGRALAASELLGSSAISEMLLDPATMIAVVRDAYGEVAREHGATDADLNGDLF